MKLAVKLPPCILDFQSANARISWGVRWRASRMGPRAGVPRPRCADTPIEGDQSQVEPVPINPTTSAMPAQETSPTVDGCYRVNQRAMRN